MTHLAAPHALLGVASALFGDLVMDGGTDLLDSHGGVGRADVEGGVDMVL